MSEIQHVELVSANGDSRVVVSTWGGRVISWKYRGYDIIFRNGMLEHDEVAASHAGIPVLFPQFGFFGDGVKHGFVRETNWRIESTGRDQCILVVGQDEIKEGAASFHFVARVIVQLDENRLRVWLQFENPSKSDEMTFTTGLHTYLSVDDIGNVNISGLQGTNYLDATADLAPSVELESVVEFATEVDRVYLDTSANLLLNSGRGQLIVDQSGFQDTVIWNPGSTLGPKFKDFTPDEWRRFVCIEAAQIQNPVTLRPGETWTGSQTLTVR